jgi:hypothetical protein
LRSLIVKFIYGLGGRPRRSWHLTGPIRSGRSA